MASFPYSFTPHSLTYCTPTNFPITPLGPGDRAVKITRWMSPDFQAHLWCECGWVGDGAVNKRIKQNLVVLRVKQVTREGESGSYGLWEAPLRTK